MAQTATAPKAIPSIPKRPPALLPNALKRADLERGDFLAIVPSNITYEQVMTPAYWSNHVQALAHRPFARVEVVREDGSMDLDLRVIGTKPGMVMMRCLRKFIDNADLGTGLGDGSQPGDEGLDPPDGYKWGFVPRGAERGHMIRLPNGDVLVKGLMTKRAAIDAARTHAAVANTPASEPPAPAEKPADPPVA